MQILNYSTVENIVMTTIKNLIRNDMTCEPLIKVLTDQNLYSHSIEVAQYSVALALYFNKDEKTLVDIAQAGLLHDFGKVFIDRKILYKPGRLTPEEFEVVKEHPTKGYINLTELMGTKKDTLVLNAIKKHHETMNGVGYPNHLFVSDFEIQIISVADILSALTEVRVYKEAMYLSKAREILEEKVAKGELDNSIVGAISYVFVDEYEIYDIHTKAASFFRKYFKQQQKNLDAWRSNLYIFENKEGDKDGSE